MAWDFERSNSDALQRINGPGITLPITISVWFTTEDEFQNFQTLVRLSSAAPVTSYIEVRLPKPGIGVTVGALSNSGFRAREAQAGGNVINNQWHHAHARFVSSSARYAYLDGANIGSNTQFSLGSLSGAPTIYVGTSKNTNYHDGKIAEIAIWNVDINTNQDISYLASGGDPREVQPTQLLAYWPLIRSKHELIGGKNLVSLSGIPGPASDHPAIFRMKPRFTLAPSPAVVPAGTSAMMFGANF